MLSNLSHEQLTVFLRALGKMIYRVDAPTVPTLVNALYSNRNDFTLNELITVIWGLTRTKLVTRKSWDPKTTDTTEQMIQLLFDQASSGCSCFS